MTVLPQTHNARIALAIALSLLAHAIMLSVPLAWLPPGEVPLPPLTAKLEPLPEIAAKPAPPRKHKPRPQPARAEPAAEMPASSEPAGNSHAEEPQANPEPQPAAIEQTAEEPKPAHPLPKHARLTFFAYKGTDFMIGEARHSLEIGDDKNYTLKVGMNTTGLAGFFKTFESNQQSSGKLTSRGLRPDEFSEAKNTSKGKETLEARFDWEGKTLSFLNGSKTPLPEQAQDIISILYQLSQLPLEKGVIQIYISNGKKLERYELSIDGKEEEIQTRLGTLRALPLHKIHAQGEEGLDIWLGLEYRLLPVKVRQIDRSGKIAGEMVISEILVADE